MDETVPLILIALILFNLFIQRLRKPAVRTWEAVDGLSASGAYHRCLLRYHYSYANSGLLSSLSSMKWVAIISALCVTQTIGNKSTALLNVYLSAPSGKPICHLIA